VKAVLYFKKFLTVTTHRLALNSVSRKEGLWYHKCFLLFTDIALNLWSLFALNRILLPSAKERWA